MARDDDERTGASSSLTFLQRQSLKRVIKEARKHPDEELSPDDWEAYFRFSAQPRTRFGKRILRAIPSTPRCGYCGAPFAGVGARIVGPLGYRPSRKNPNVCSTCVELAPPGGTTMEIGVLFADLRGFTSDSELRTPAETSATLRRFYAHAEKVFFPDALIDKLIGDEIMALYVPSLVTGSVDGDLDDDARQHIAHVMLGHAKELLERVGYGSGRAPEFAVGIGLDFGEAFVGNIGNSAVRDFTAVGDVVNTASRLQSQAAPGEVVVSERLVRQLREPVGSEERIELKGKQSLVDIRRVSWFGPKT